MLRLRPPKIIYDQAQGLPTIKHSLAEDPIILSDSPHPFEFELSSKPAFEKTNVYNYSHSYAGMEIKMQRKTLGELLSGYYYPMAAFAILSVISYLIKPEMVSNCFSYN